MNFSETEEGKKLLHDFIEEQAYRLCCGSGDDQFYAQQVRDYIKKQIAIWREFEDIVFMAGMKNIKNHYVKKYNSCDLNEEGFCKNHKVYHKRVHILTEKGKGILKLIGVE